MAISLLRTLSGAPVENEAEWEQRRKELIGVLAENLFGVPPAPPERVHGEILQTEHKIASGHAVCQRILLSVPTAQGAFSFPIWLTLPKADTPVPVFVLLDFHAELYNKYCPLEEIIDNGFGVASVYYEDVSSDDADFTNGIARCFPDCRQEGNGTGKIGFWAWGAGCVLEYLLTRPDIAGDKIALVGHSRLGKTALWAAALDRRFAFACSNDAGCAGAALEEEKHAGAETYADIIRRFPHWFCPNFYRYARETAPFDQHFLIAAQAPHPVAVGSASCDAWADPPSEQKSCLIADEVYRMLGLPGYCGEKSPAKAGDTWTDGSICYHLRDGCHFLGRSDWQVYMEFAKKQFGIPLR